MKFPIVVLFDDEYARTEFMKWFDNYGDPHFRSKSGITVVIDCDYYSHVIDVVDPYKDKDE